MSYNSKVFKFSKRKYDIFWPTLWRIFVFIGIVWGRGCPISRILCTICDIYDWLP